MQVKRIREGHKIKGAGRDMDEHKQDEARKINGKCKESNKTWTQCMTGRATQQKVCFKSHTSGVNTIF